MGLRINHNLATINALRNLQYKNGQVDDGVQKLASGLKLNRAKDGAATLALSERLRGQITGLNQAASNTETGISLVQTVEAQMSELNSLLVNARQIALHAANSGVNDEKMMLADQKELSRILASIDSIAENASFVGVNLLDGSYTPKLVIERPEFEIVSAGPNMKEIASEGIEIRVFEQPSQHRVYLTRLFKLSADLFNDTLEKYKTSIRQAVREGDLKSAVTQAEGLIGDINTIKIDFLHDEERNAFNPFDQGLYDKVATANELDVKHDDLLEEIVTSKGEHLLPQFLVLEKDYQPVGGYSIDYPGFVFQINNELDFESEQLERKISDAKSDSERLVLEKKLENLGKLAKRTQAVTTALDTKTDELWALQKDTNPYDYMELASIAKDSQFTVKSIGNSKEISSKRVGNIVATINGEATRGVGDTITGIEGSCVDGLEIKMLKPLWKEGQNVPEDGVYAGRLFGKINPLIFQVGGNRGQLAKLNLPNARSNALGMKVQNQSNFKNLSEIRFDDAATINDSLLLIDAAINQISTHRSKLGSVQKNWFSSNLSNIKYAEQELASAESVLRNTDMAKEMSKNVRNNLQQGMVIDVLSQTKLQSEHVLNLLS